ncbi:hypothetical protein ACGRHY_21965 [Streptomyces sp. HK10]|uniref:hypothetical protein n=1 Tax=Streptomyces sp. HK10 TaxID=3373255 RepID=UPI003748823E
MIVGTDVQPYEPSRTRNAHLNRGQIPGMRAPHEPMSGHFPATPIYDALYAEYRRLFRALPGDRSGEEELRFTGFGTGTAHWNGGPRIGGFLPAGPAPAVLPPAPRDGRPYDR